MTNDFVSRAERAAEDLGHDVVWDEVGEHLAHGHCAKCGMTLSAASPDGLSKTVGDALERECPYSDAADPAEDAP